MGLSSIAGIGSSISSTSLSTSVSGEESGLESGYFSRICLILLALITRNKLNHVAVRRSWIFGGLGFDHAHRIVFNYNIQYIYNVCPSMCC